eukprot:jgi/Chlat1/8211/Chrsp76S07644
MLAVFANAVAPPPQELQDAFQSNATPSAGGSTLEYLEKLRKPVDAFPSPTATVLFGQNGGLAYQAAASERISFGADQGIFILFRGELTNAGDIREAYGYRRSESISDHVLIIEMYKTLKDRAPFPTDHCLRQLHGSFAFALYDASTNVVFAARDAKGCASLHWGVGADGAMILASDDAAAGLCGTLTAPFPRGCFYVSNHGIRSFEHPNKMLKASARIDQNGKKVLGEYEVDMSRSYSFEPHRIGSSADLTFLVSGAQS